MMKALMGVRRGSIVQAILPGAAAMRPRLDGPVFCEELAD
jgi:hypothetical protein